MPDITHRIGIEAAPSRVYAALSTIEGLAGWWTRGASGRPTTGGRLLFTFQDPAGVEKGRFEMAVLECAAEDQVRWTVEAGPPEWIGTEISFRLAQQDGQTIVLFGHRYWREESEFKAHCSMKWATFLLSLRDLVERGSGRPAPDDLKIDNWN
jgi:uncharacterized protein YndB with AHSA1/START domain